MLGEVTDRLLGGVVQHSVHVPGGEDLLVGAVVAVHRAVLVQDEEEAATVARALCVLVGGRADRREHGVVEQVGTRDRPLPCLSECVLRHLHGRQYAAGH